MREEDKKRIVFKVLKEHPDGLTIQEVSKLGKMSRITATIYLHELLGEGKVVERKTGAYRLFYPQEKYLESVREKELIEKLREKIK